MDDYADLLSAVLTDYDIPLYLDGKASVAHHPLVEFIRSALECVTGGWRTEALFRCAKTDLLGTPARRPTRDEIDRLENYALAAGIDGWRWRKDYEWQPLPGGDLEAESRDDGQAAEPQDEHIAALMDIRNALLAP